MAVLSNNGRLISSLPIASSISTNDEFLLQTNGITKRITYSTLSSSVVQAAISSLTFNPYTPVVNFNNGNNKFTGSFDVNIIAGDGLSGGGILTTNRTLAVNNSVVRTTGSQAIGGTKTFVATILGNINSSGTSTFSTIDVNGGAIDGTTIGSTSPTTIVGTTVNGTTITATVGFAGDITSTGTSNFTKIISTRITGSTGINGNVTGNLTGDIYTQTGTKVLENGTGATTANGGVPTSFYYGTSSYATQALTAAFASNTTVVNGIPSGGSTYQQLAKLSNTSYDVGWSTPITRSEVGGANQLVLWSSGNALKNSDIYYNGTDGYVMMNNTFLDTDKLIGNVVDGTIVSGSFYYTTDHQEMDGVDQLVLNGDMYPTLTLHLTQSGNVTMSLYEGQITNVLVKNGGAFNVTKWSGSLDGGVNANVAIYWESGGTTPVITSGAGKKDIVTFKNISNYIFGTIIQDFRSATP